MKKLLGNKNKKTVTFTYQVKFDVQRSHFPLSITKHFLKTEQKNIKTKI